MKKRSSWSSPSSRGSGRALALAFVLLGGVLVLASDEGRAGERDEPHEVTSKPQPILVMPGPTRGPRSAERLDRNDDCVACHDDIAREWSHSLHRQAYNDPMFQAALEREQEPGFCRTCHAPEADPRHEPSTRQADAGVACVTCHVTGVDEAVLAAAKPGHDDAGVPHALRREASFGSVDACARCHEFWFPSAGREGHELKMQRTVAEHARSRFADEACQACHMEPRRSTGAVHRGHRFAVANQPAMLRAAVSIMATRPEPRRVVLELEPRLLGHAFPTGDLFRRIAVELRGADGQLLETIHLTRHFTGQRVGKGQVIKVERSDDRIGMGEGPRVVEFVVPAEHELDTLGWALVHERAMEAAIGSEHDADVWDRTTFASGTLALP